MYQKGIQAAEKAGFDAVIVSSAANMKYLSGFTGEGYLYLSQKKKVVVTDFRYVYSARKECLDFEIVDRGKGLFEPLIGVIGEEKKIGFEGDILTYSDYRKLSETLPEKQFDSVENEFRYLRSIKTKEEIEQIEKAENIGDIAFQEFLKTWKPGMTEREVADLLECSMKRAGAEGLSFDTIAASGIHSSMPHAVLTDKVLEEGDFLTMDFGCRFGGYCSDMTRTVVIGKASEKQKEIYKLVLHAQEETLRRIRPGMLGCEVDAIARDIITEAGYGDCFGHGLGHSVGLEIHELPAFSVREQEKIKPGMVITVEPGVYIEGFGGVRIEDVVVITEDGCRNLTHSPKELVELC